MSPDPRLPLSRDVYARLIEAQRTPLTRYALKLCRNPELAEDLVQDTIIRAIGTRNPWDGRAQLGVWLMRILRNRYFDYRKLAASREVLDCDLSPDMVDGIEAIAVEEEVTGIASAVRSACSQLPPTLARVLARCDLDDWKYQEYADEEGVPIGTVKSRLNRARLAIRPLLAHLN